MDRLEPARVLWIAAGDHLPEEARAAEAMGGFALEHAPGIAEAVEYLRRSRIDAAIACFPLPEWNSAEALEELQRAAGSIPVILWDTNAGVADAVRLARLGAFDILGAGARAEEISGVIEAAIEERRSQPESDASADEPWRRKLVGSSGPFEDVVRMVRLVGNRRCTVLITGETGTGKEMAAQAVHMAGPRGRLPMVSVCCSALPENLLEAELFGHVRGAFTGAVNQRAGRFEQANGSTIFLDEIGEMPLELQAKLLRVLQEREFQRLGSSETIKVDVRVIAATNVDLLERVKQGTFREDLYYRLNDVSIQMPALRERTGDIAPLAQHFIRKICNLEGIPLKQISREALERLTRYSWPGNVRQLENAIERAIVLSGERNMLYPSDFPLGPGLSRRTAEPAATPFVLVPDDGLDFDQTVGQIARSIIEQALSKTKGNKKLAADMLRLKRTTLAAKLRSLETDSLEPALMESGFLPSA